MKPTFRLHFSGWKLPWLILVLAAFTLVPNSAHASIFKGEALDKAADVLTWAVLVLAPLIGITIFLLIHILPEKIAEKKQHPQAKAIQCLCLLSLVFGGLLWPLAWLWAYTKPVFHKVAYGTDRHEEEEVPEEPRITTSAETEELDRLRRRVAELETKQGSKIIVE